MKRMKQISPNSLRLYLEDMGTSGGVQARRTITDVLEVNAGSLWVQSFVFHIQRQLASVPVPSSPPSKPTGPIPVPVATLTEDEVPHAIPDLDVGWRFEQPHGRRLPWHFHLLRVHQRVRCAAQFMGAHCAGSASHVLVAIPDNPACRTGLIVGGLCPAHTGFWEREAKKDTPRNPLDHL